MKNNSNSTGARKFSTVEALKRLLSEIKGLNPKSVDKFVEDVKTVEEANEKALEAKKAKEERRLAREAERAAEPVKSANRLAGFTWVIRSEVSAA